MQMKTTAVQRYVNCLVAEKRALHGEFKAYWKKTAQDIAIKNNIDIEDVKQKHLEEVAVKKLKEERQKEEQ